MDPASTPAHYSDVFSAYARLRRRVERLLAGVDAPVADAGSLFAALEESLEEAAVLEQELRERDSELQAAWQELADERARYRDLFEFAPDGYLVTDPAGLILEANRAARQLLCPAGGQLQGRPLALLVPPAEREEFRTRLRQAAEGRFSDDWLVGIQPRGGDPWTAELRVCTVRDAAGAPCGLRWTVRDVSRREGQRRDADRHAQLAVQALENVHESVVVTAPSGRILAVNPAFQAVTGYAAAEAVGCDIDLVCSARHERDFFARMWRQVAKQGRWRGEIRHRRKNGEVDPGWLSVSAIRDPHGAIVNYVGVFSVVGNWGRKQERPTSTPCLDSDLARPASGGRRLTQGPVRLLEASLFRLQGFCHAMDELYRQPGSSPWADRAAVFEDTGIPARMVADLLADRRVGEHGGSLCQAALRACECDMPAFPCGRAEQVRRGLERVRDVLAAIQQLQNARPERCVQVHRVLARTLGLSAMHARRELLVHSFPYCERVTREALDEVLAFRAAGAG